MIGFKGGQGRSPESIISDASALLWWAVAAVLVAVAIAGGWL